MFQGKRPEANAWNEGKTVGGRDERLPEKKKARQGSRGGGGEVFRVKTFLRTQVGWGELAGRTPQKIRKTNLGGERGG